MAGRGTTTRDKLVESALKFRAAVDITDDTEMAVRKDVADHIYWWKKPRHEMKPHYVLSVTEDQDGNLTCVAVDGRPYDEYMAGRVR